jgi:hypothetical protein
MIDMHQKLFWILLYSHRVRILVVQQAQCIAKSQGWTNKLRLQFTIGFGWGWTLSKQHCGNYIIIFLFSISTGLDQH